MGGNIFFFFLHLNRPWSEASAAAFLSGQKHFIPTGNLFLSQPGVPTGLSLPPLHPLCLLIPTRAQTGASNGATSRDAASWPAAGTARTWGMMLPSSHPCYTADCRTAHLGNIAINPAAGFQISDCDGDCWRENRQLSAVSFT